MAASENVRQLTESHNSNSELIVPHHGVVTLFGYGIQVRVDRGHLLLEDGVGPDRRYARLPRVGHGLKRLVVIGSDGAVSFAALQWLSAQDVSLTFLDRNGKVLFVTGPVRSSDARLRRAQAMASGSGAALRIARELISQKLAGQEQVVRNKLLDLETAKSIANFRSRVDKAETIDEIRQCESMGAAVYWSAWRNLSIFFPKSDLPRVPDHWRVFETRKSPLSGSQRLAANPANACLNYLYAIFESEARLALAALGLDPGLGVLHNDSPSRDSLACDVMEPIRPQIDAYVLDWITSQVLKREWFFEQRDGTCRLMSSLASRLAETATTWRRVVAPVAEMVAREFWSTKSTSRSTATIPTHLTQQHRREAKGSSTPSNVPVPRPSRVCRRCGVVLERGHRDHCAKCGVSISRENLIEIAKEGRLKSRSAESRAKQSASQERQHAARKSWDPLSLPAWLNESTYRKLILPRLSSITVPVLARTLSVSEPYATKVRKGQHVPHPMHWKALSELVGTARLG
jgi:CRISPR-associated endonuclease Cas1